MKKVMPDVNVKDKGGNAHQRSRPKLGPFQICNILYTVNQLYLAAIKFGLAFCRYNLSGHTFLYSL